MPTNPKPEDDDRRTLLIDTWGAVMEQAPDGSWQAKRPFLDWLPEEEGRKTVFNRPNLANPYGRAVNSAPGKDPRTPTQRFRSDSV